jgi:hypothetical protein
LTLGIEQLIGAEVGAAELLSSGRQMKDDACKFAAAEDQSDTPPLQA